MVLSLIVCIACHFAFTHFCVRSQVLHIYTEYFVETLVERYILVIHPFQVQLFDVGLFNNLDGAGYINTDDGVWSPESLCDVVHVQCPVS